MVASRLSPNDGDVTGSDQESGKCGWTEGAPRFGTVWPHHISRTTSMSD